MKIPHMSMAPPALGGGAPVRGERGRRQRRRGRWRRVALGVVVIAVLGAVFMSYLSPDMMFTLATQVWSCF